MTFKKPRLAPLFASFLFLLSISPAYSELHNGMDASVVVGQPDFTTRTSGTTQNMMNVPLGVFSDGKRLFVVDGSNNRVLIYNSIPTSNHASADVVVGQPDFTTGTAGTTRNTMSSPGTAFSDGRRLFVADRLNHRVLIYNSIPTSNNASADVVVGQPDFTTGTSGTTQNKMNLPTGVFSDGRRLFVADRSNHRVLIYNSIPTSNNASADVVVGQPDFTTGTSGTAQNKMNNASSVFSDGKRLFVADQTNRRILIYRSIPTVNNALADVVLGQPDFMTGTSGISRNKMSQPFGVFSDGKRLFIADLNNHRVLIHSSVPTSNNAPADGVLGQPDFMTGTSGTSQNKMNFPENICSDGKRLFVADAINHRVLIFNIGGSGVEDFGPHFDQGKAVVGKVFWDWNGNGKQDAVSEYGSNGVSEIKIHSDTPILPHPETGIEGVKVVSDTGIYAITDEDGKYHFPFIQPGQHVLKLDESTLPEGAVMTTESPRKIVVTEGVLTKVSFGVKTVEGGGSKVEGETNAIPSIVHPRPSTDSPLLKVSISQDAAKLAPKLAVSAVQSKNGQGEDIIKFTIDTNYPLFIKKAVLKIWQEKGDRSKDLSPFSAQSLELPMPLPYEYSIPLTDLASEQEVKEGAKFMYQLSVYDENDHEDRTGMGRLELI